MNQQPLRELIRQRMDLRWADFAREHPHLARAIDRSVLTSVTVDAIESDPEYRRALAQSHINEAQLRAVMRLVELIEQAMDRVLPAASMLR